MQEYFKEIEDTRHQSYVKHQLRDILVMIMCAVLCGKADLQKDNSDRMAGQSREVGRIKRHY